MAATTATPLSLENTATAADTASPASQAAFRRPTAWPPRMWHSRPANTPSAASSSARPTMLVTDSVSRGCSAHKRGQQAGPRNLSQQQQSQEVNQGDVDGMQSEIHPVIAGRVRAVAQHRVVEQKRERGERPVESRGDAGIPVFFGEDLPDVGGSHGSYARVLLDGDPVVERETGLKRVGVGQQGGEPQAQQDGQVAPPLEQRCGGADRAQRAAGDAGTGAGPLASLLHASPGTPPRVRASLTARRMAAATASAAATPEHVDVGLRGSPSESAKTVSPSNMVFTG